MHPDIDFILDELFGETTRFYDEVWFRCLPGAFVVHGSSKDFFLKIENPMIIPVITASETAGYL